MADSAEKLIAVREVAENVAAALVSVRHWGEASFIKLPLVYPSGSFVTVRITQAPGGYRVSDGGLAFREIERFGAERSFSGTVRGVIEGKDTLADRRTIFADVTAGEVEAAVYEVAIASHQVAEQIVAKASEVHAEDIAEALQERLVRVFGVDRVAVEQEVVGSSSTSWKVSAVTRSGDHIAVFQAVSQTPMSIFRTSAAFHDLAVLNIPPRLVAVVESKARLGKNLSLLAQAGQVIEVGQSDDVFRRAAA